MGRIELSLAFPNGTDYGVDNTTKYTRDRNYIEIPYSLNLYGCRFAPDSHCSNNDWLEVLTMMDQTAYIMEDRLQTSYGSSAELFSIFQNQENIINNGWVSSYRLSLTFHNNTALISQSSSQAILEFGYNDGHTLSFEKLGRTILFCLNFLVLLVWIVKNHRVENAKSFTLWLPEKKWLTYMIVATLLYQNPALILAQYNDAPSMSLAVATKCIMVLSYSLLGWIFLLFADGVSRSLKTPFEFYFAKTLLMVLYFILSLTFELIATPVFGGEEWRGGALGAKFKALRIPR